MQLVQVKCIKIIPTYLHRCHAYRKNIRAVRAPIFWAVSDAIMVPVTFIGWKEYDDIIE